MRFYRTGAVASKACLYDQLSDVDRRVVNSQTITVQRQDRSGIPVNTGSTVRCSSLGTSFEWRHVSGVTADG
jgi:hypothetical protein